MEGVEIANQQCISCVAFSIPDDHASDIVFIFSIVASLYLKGNPAGNRLYDVRVSGLHESSGTIFDFALDITLERMCQHCCI